MPFVISIQHTGTRFVKNLLGLGKSDHIHIVGEINPKEWAERYQGPIVVPIRDPANVLLSWQKRGKPIVTGGAFTSCWQSLIQLQACHHDLWLIPVDHKNRESFLTRLENRLITKFETNWEPITEWNGWAPGQDRNVPNYDLTWIYTYLRNQGIDYKPNVLKGTY